MKLFVLKSIYKNEDQISSKMKHRNCSTMEFGNKNEKQTDNLSNKIKNYKSSKKLFKMNSIGLVCGIMETQNNNGFEGYQNKIRRVDINSPLKMRSKLYM